MKELEAFWGKERGRHFYNISDAGSTMVAERINLQSLDLRLTDLPLCSEEEAVYIEGLIPRAMDGFSLALKSENISNDELLDLFEEAKPKTISGVWNNLRLSERQNTLPEYGHTLASLAVLLKMGKVSFFDFSAPPEDVGYDLGNLASFWYCSRTTPGQIFAILQDLEHSIRTALYQRQPIETKELLKVGHFFQAGKEISKIFVD